MDIFGSRSHFLGFEIGVGVPGRHFSSPQYWPWCQSQHPSAHSFCLKKYDIAAEKQKIQDKNISCRSSSDRRSRPLSHKALSCPLACYRSVWKCENVKVWKCENESEKVWKCPPACCRSANIWSSTNLLPTMSCKMLYLWKQFGRSE